MYICVENALIKGIHILHLLSMYQPVKLFFYCCAVHYGIYILFTHQQMHFSLNSKRLNLH